MINSSEFKKWDVYLAYVKYEEINFKKKRPVLIIDDKKQIVLSFKITKHPPRDENDYQIQKWSEAGLLYKSTVRLGRLLRIEKEDFICKIGHLEKIDLNHIDKLIK